MATSRCEAKVYERRINRKTGSEDVKVLPGLEASAEDGDKDYAIVVWRIFNEKQQKEKAVLQVQSPFVLKAFREVIGSYSTVASDFRTPFELESPFQMLVHYWDELDAYRQAAEDSDVRMHLNLLFDFMNVELGYSRQLQTAMLEKKHITYKTLWTIFRPGDILYKAENGHPWLLRCHKTGYEESSTIGPYCTVTAHYTDFDGKIIGDAAHEVIIRQKQDFVGDNPALITDLKVYPLKFWGGDPEELKAGLQARGQRFLQVRGVEVKYYNGTAEYLKEPPYDYYHNSLLDGNGFWLPFTETGRVVLDRTMFEEEARLEAVGIKFNPDAEPVFCPPFFNGYSPARKTWCRYYVDSTSEVPWKENPWDDLILKAEQKLVLKALVSAHVFPENSRDEMQQKGKGLVVLLHGSPGSGKTLTAACAAEAAHKVLITATIGELNKDSYPASFEWRLRSLLQYATSWQAVVLLDEADVFLEARKEDSTSNSERNALVAVFLKHLEFFSGIVFLTTNRIGVFDSAMKSRIHLALGYTPPGLETRRQLWLQLLSTIPPEDIDMVLDEDTDELLTEKLNGREIAYTINTARTIARYEKQPLRIDHIRTVVAVRTEFDKSLRETAKRAPTVASGTSMTLTKRDSILEVDEYKS